MTTSSRREWPGDVTVHEASRVSAFIPAARVRKASAVCLHAVRARQLGRTGEFTGRVARQLWQRPHASRA
eukprot:5021932-Prymnesium_polylepis.1